MEKNEAYSGVVVGHSRAGIYIDLENGVRAFSFHGAAEGSRVICGVRSTSDKYPFPCVVVESVLYN